MNLPKITNGTTKQINWAEKIRSTWIKKLTAQMEIIEISLNQNNLNDIIRKDYEGRLKDYKILLEQYTIRDDAEWFIEWRNGVYQGQRGCKNYL